MKLKNDFITNSSSTSYIFSSTNKSHTKNRLMVEVDITKINGVNIEEITWEILKEIEETGEYDGENVPFSLNKEQFEYCKQMLESGEKIFYVNSYDDGIGPLGFLEKAENISIQYIDGY